VLALEEASAGRRAIAVTTFLARLREDGATPQRIFFAGRRFRRWLEANPQATLEAQGRHLGELWGTYRLSELEPAWPDTRLRFFRSTVFAEARPQLGAALDRLMSRARALPAGALDLAEQVAAIRAAVKPTEAEDWFLARMTYPYLAPSDDVALISMPHEGHVTTEVVVALADDAGNRFSVRGPVSPREVARLLHLFNESSLQVSFSGEHEFLLALDAKGTVLGGLFHRSAGRTRVHTRGGTAVETGYFQPDYLKRFGFRTDPGSGGLVRDIGPGDDFSW
jgi:long-chain acyl-CoA synthetase